MGHKYKVLWIEDEAATLNSIMNPLRRKGAQVDQICNKADAMSLSRPELKEYDLIILDILLPETKGSPYGGNFLEDILKHIRKNLQSDIPIVVLSILTQQEHQEILSRYKVADFIPKPTEVKEITDSVMSLLNGPK
jgi:DNA-binding response OmpR family regulator